MNEFLQKYYSTPLLESKSLSEISTQHHTSQLSNKVSDMTNQLYKLTESVQQELKEIKLLHEALLKQSQLQTRLLESLVLKSGNSNTSTPHRLPRLLNSSFSDETSITQGIQLDLFQESQITNMTMDE